MPRILPFLLVALGAAATLPAQAVERTDIPAPGRVRLSFDPKIEAWDDAFWSGTRRPLGWFLTGDSAGGTIPAVTRLQQDVRTAGGLPGFVASLGRGALFVRSERRILPITLDYGITKRLAVGVMVPLERVRVREHFRLDSATANLGANPRGGDPTAFNAFFAEFDSTLARLDQNIATGHYGCPGSGAACVAAQQLSAQGHSVRQALYDASYGPGAGGYAPFLPTDSSDGGKAIAASVAQIQQQLANDTVAGFTTGFLLPSQRLDGGAFESLLQDESVGLGSHVFEDTPKFYQWWLGDVELSATYRAIVTPRYIAAISGVMRLPTGHRDSPRDPFDLSTGDHQLDLEARLTQELSLGRLWLNLSLRGAQQAQGTRSRLVAPPLAFFAPLAADAALRWDPGDYVAADIAPMYRFNRFFAVGITAGFFTKGRDSYTFQTTQDSVNLAARLGAPASAAILDAGTATRYTRMGVAATYAGGLFEGGLSIEQTVSAGGSDVPAATVFRLVMRTSRRLF
ncbi:MAG TPA: hypothetical protein VNH63_11950 [Gemmatimonadales bacterium]|nr:hypothetical protein [Gemmatimonadales bacterium]